MRRILGLIVGLGMAAMAAPAVRAEAVQVPGSRAEIALSFAPVVQVASPSVVSIYARRVVERRIGPFAGDEMFERLFRDFGATRPEVQNSLGSGVIVASDGLVVSNYHVVEGAEEITVVLQDRRRLQARVILSDQGNDLAVLRLEAAEDLPAIAFRDSDEVAVGDLVLAIGNPFGLDQTVSMGIISALSRSEISVGDGRGYFLQTDAAINPGNSGGALVDHQGRLVGINTAILTRSGGSNGVGFAIPANLVRSVVSQATEGRAEFQRPWAGASGQAVDFALAESLGQRVPEGILLSDLHPQSPFARAGLRAGDLILRFDGHAVQAPQELLYRMSALGIGRRAEVVYRRGDAEARADLEMIAPPDVPARDPQRLGPAAGPLQGLTLWRVNPAVEEEFRLGRTPEGALLVAELEGLAARTGLRRGDLLLGLNGRRITEPADIARIVAAWEGRNWQLEVLRAGQSLRLRFRT